MSRSAFCLSFQLVMALFVSLAAGLGTAAAATLTVDTLNDELADNGSCSLREAITTVNGGDQSGSADCIGGDPAAPDTITFSVSGTITLGSLLPTVNQDLSIDGPGADNLTLSGNNSDRVLRIGAGVTAVIQELTLSGGMVSGTGGGGIYNQGNLTVSNCVISNNQDSGGAGGGIFNDGGGSILTITDSTISGNSSSQGGGIYNMGTVLIERSTLSGNSASSSGGAIYNDNSLSLTLNNVTISGNQSIAGAGLYIQPVTTNSFDNCTIVDNQNTLATKGAGIFVSGSPVYNIRNTIISNNSNQNGSSNCYQVFTSLGYNISSDSTCFTLPLAAGDMQNTDPLLGTLQDNGGPTFTHALQQGSPAIDAGDPANCPATDQRSVTRPENGVCDIGAYELAKSVFPWPIILSNIAGQAQEKAVWRVVTRVTCPTPLTFTVTLEGTSRSSVMRPLIDFEGTYSDWASTVPGAKKFTWQATCPGYPPGWSGSVDRTLKDGMNYLLILNDGGGLPVVNVEERQGIPAGARKAAE